MEIVRHRPDNLSNPDTVIVAPYPFNGNQRNTSPRLEVIANRVGSDVLGFPRPATGLLLGSLALRECLKEDSMLGVHLDIAERLQPEVDGFKNVVALGDSTASYTVEALILSGLLPFTHALFRDGVNLKAPQKAGFAQYNYLRYQMVEERKKSQEVTRIAESEISTDDSNHLPQAEALRALWEIFHYSPLWRSLYSKEALENIASYHTDLPLHIVGLEHTFTGSPEQWEQFGEELVAMRKIRGPEAAPASFTFEPGLYHSDLINPLIAVRHLKQTLDLTETA